VFVRALALSGQLLGHGKGFVGKFVRRWVFAIRGMPSNGQHLADKYLVEVFNKLMNFIKDTIKDEKITIIIDESPDIMGRKTVNTYFSFFNAQERERERERNIYLVDVSFVKIFNTDTITLLVNSIVSRYGKDWRDIIAISIDSASYMECFYNNVKERHNS
jgi:hypothetical protein